MENITLGQIGLAITFLVTLITGGGFLMKKLKEFIASTLTEKFNAVDMRLNDIEDAMFRQEMDSCKDYLSDYMDRIEDGGIPRNKERFYERYDWYIKHDGNSFIKERVEYLKEKELL